jgi:hypothetical protein
LGANDWSITPEAAGDDTNPYDKVHDGVNINCCIHENELKVWITAGMGSSQTCRLKDALYRSILNVIGYCTSREQVEYAPSDFAEGFDPYIRVNAEPFGNKEVLFMLPPGLANGEYYLNNIIPNLNGQGIISFNNYFLHIENMIGEESDRIGYEFLASYHITQLKQIQPVGPYYLFGYSYGGFLAFEMARQLTANGDQVKKVILVDPFFKMGESSIRALLSGNPDKHLNCRYEPVINNRYVAENIILFKADRVPAIYTGEEEILKYYVSTRDNHLSDLVGMDNLEVIHMDDDHASCLENARWLAKISEACQLNHIKK